MEILSIVSFYILDLDPRWSTNDGRSCLGRRAGGSAVSRRSRRAAGTARLGGSPVARARFRSDVTVKQQIGGIGLKADQAASNGERQPSEGKPCQRSSSHCSSRSSSRSCWASPSAWPNPDLALQMKPLGDGFIKLIKMLVPVIVFCVVVHGIAAAGDLSKVGRVGIRALIYFEIVTTIALVFGIGLAYYFEPGVGMNIDPKTLDAKALERLQPDRGSGRRRRRLRIPDEAHPLDDCRSAFTLRRHPAGADRLDHVRLRRLLVRRASQAGGRVHRARERDHLQDDEFRRPAGADRRLRCDRLHRREVRRRFAQATRRARRACSIWPWSCLSIVVLGAIMRLSGFSLFKLLAYLREELTIVLGTAAGDSVLPQTMRKLEQLGIKRSTVGLVIPTGYSFNLDAFSIYLTLAAVFIAQATNTPLATGDLLAILGIALLTSKGAHGVPGSAIVVLAATLAALSRHSGDRPRAASCRSTGSSALPARSAIMSETALPPSPSRPGKATSTGKRRIAS